MKSPSRLQKKIEAEMEQLLDSYHHRSWIDNVARPFTGYEIYRGSRKIDKHELHWLIQNNIVPPYIHKLIIPKKDEADDSFPIVKGHKDYYVRDKKGWKDGVLVNPIEAGITRTGQY